MISALSVCLLVGSVGSGEVDTERAAWRYKRQVEVLGRTSLVSLVLPPEMSQKAGPGLRDLRLVDGSGREVPYLLDWSTDREGLVTWQASLGDIRRERLLEDEASGVRSQWTIDLGEVLRFTELNVRVPDVAFAWHVRVESSTDGGSYRVAAEDAALFDQVWNGERVRKTEVRFAEPESARYLRLTARSAPGSQILELSGAAVTLRQRLREDAWSKDVSASPVETPGTTAGRTRYRLGASSLLPFGEVEIDCDDTTFVRRVWLIEAGASASKNADITLGEGRIFRIRGGEAVVAGEASRIVARHGHGGDLYLEVDNAGSPPLRGLRVRFHGSRVRLLFPSSDSRVTLYYGNETTRDPGYDIEALRPRLTQVLDVTKAVPGAEEENPAYRREPPLRFAATLGASLDPSPWRRTRGLAPIASEDVYALTLRVEDLATLRADLADLRVVDQKNRQVPFLIDPDFTEERVDLRVRPQDPAPRRSVYSLVPTGAFEGESGPRATRVELVIQDAFFERRARLRNGATPSRREPPFSISLSRRPPAVDPIVIGSLTPLQDLTLEIDDGDNASLDIRAATAIVRVPRVVFKAAPGELRLLLGNRQASPPRYDIAGLRSELLAYSAIPARALPLTSNDGANESLLSRVESAPRNVVVWSAIIVAIVALVALTVRTIRAA